MHFGYFTSTYTLNPKMKRTSLSLTYVWQVHISQENVCQGLKLFSPWCKPECKDTNDWYKHNVHSK